MISLEDLTDDHDDCYEDEDEDEEILWRWWLSCDESYPVMTWKLSSDESYNSRKKWWLVTFWLMVMLTHVLWVMHDGCDNDLHWWPLTQRLWGSAKFNAGCCWKYFKVIYIWWVIIINIITIMTAKNPQYFASKGGEIEAVWKFSGISSDIAEWGFLYLQCKQQWGKRQERKGKNRALQGIAERKSGAWGALPPTPTHSPSPTLKEKR